MITCEYCEQLHSVTFAEQKLHSVPHSAPPCVIIQTLQIELKWLRVQNRLLTELLRVHTSLPVDDMIECKDDGIHIHNFPGGNIPVIVHECMETDQPQKYILGDNPKKKKVYRTIKNQVETVVEDEKSDPEQIPQPTGCKDKILGKLEEYFETIATSRTYTPTLLRMCDTRRELLGTIDVDEYITLAMSHRDRLEGMFKTKHTGKKLRQIVSKAFSALDMRFLLYDTYYNLTVSMDDADALKNAMSNVSQPQTYEPFNRDKIYQQICNFAIARFPLFEHVSRVIFNRYGFHSLCYFPLKKSTSKDPYSFYMLEKVEGDKRYWMMECRLEEFCIDFVSSIRGYCIALFRSIYRDVFGDNDYRDVFTTCPIMEEDCVQLLQNIYTMCFPISFRNDMKALVMKHATITPTVNDKCNLSADDIIQKRRFKAEKENDEESNIVVRQLFDDIDSRNVYSFWQGKV